jgi:mono/diheme cytochrome c family protein
VVLSVLLIGGSVLLLAAALRWRRYRLPALAITVAIILRRAPVLALLITEAYPTSFQTSPTGFTAASITHGQALFLKNCVTCHGPEGEGNGPAAGLDIKPADLTLPHVQMHSDGTMFWWLSHGIDDPDGRQAMPGFAAFLSDEDRWDLIDYVRAHNAAVAMRRGTVSVASVRAPGFAVTCNGIPASTTQDLHGRAVYVTVGDAVNEELSLPLKAGVPTATLIVPPAEAAGQTPGPGTCIAADPFAAGAYAVLADLPPYQVAGTEFLIDPNGWLRVEKLTGETSGWRTTAELLATIHEIYAHPVEQATGGQHDHRL